MAAWEAGTGETVEWTASVPAWMYPIWAAPREMAGAGVDASGSPWYAKAQAWALTSGISDGSNPDGGITREELVTMLWRSAGSPDASADLSGFSDSGSVSSWAGGAILWSVANGILGGDNGALRPTAPASRAEVAAILMRFCETSGK